MISHFSAQSRRIKFYFVMYLSSLIINILSVILTDLWSLSALRSTLSVISFIYYVPAHLIFADVPSLPRTSQYNDSLNLLIFMFPLMYIQNIFQEIVCSQHLCMSSTIDIVFFVPSRTLSLILCFSFMSLNSSSTCLPSKKNTNIKTFKSPPVFTSFSQDSTPSFSRLFLSILSIGLLIGSRHHQNTLHIPSYTFNTPYNYFILVWLATPLLSVHPFILIYESKTN